MSKKIIALALAALAPAAAMAADSNVTIYGRIDYGFLSRSGDDNKAAGGTQFGRKSRKNEFEDGMAGANRIGFKGSEDLGNGLKAIFEVEFGFNGDETNATFNYNRHSWVGLTGGFGTVLGGRVDGARYSFVGKYDPFKNQTVGVAASIFGASSRLGQADRADNAIVYITPELFTGFKVLAAYTTSLIGAESAGSTATGDRDIEKGDTPLYAIAAMYDNGPLSITLDYENLQIKRNVATANPNRNKDMEFDLWVFGASYDFGVAKLSAYYEDVAGDDRASKTVSDSKGWMVGATVPLGANARLLTSYVKGKDERTGNKGECKKFGLGGEYDLSKRTNLYAGFAKTSSDGSLTCAITTAGSRRADARDGADPLNNAAPGNAVAYGDKGFNLGIAHKF